MINTKLHSHKHKLQIALREFDFLHHAEDRESSSTQISLSTDLLRPVLSMPPVVLQYQQFGFHQTVPTSPIIEMPPSPAPYHLPMVEFPDEDMYEDEIDLVEEVVEVRIYQNKCL